MLRPRLRLVLTFTRFWLRLRFLTWFRLNHFFGYRLWLWFRVGLDDDGVAYLVASGGEKCPGASVSEGDGALQDE